ncbi:MAG: sn-glycerol-3-phosphate ABC transporter ATP-binding protein UgpC [Spartobacteria bacterium]|nr:sn-glycerol-3-phosphate ABC transporter ATP-binding protein UgpC [Spartobacteria bacterium]
MADVILSKLEKTYPNGFKAVHGIDLHINDGEFMVFVGPSGCAKSTVLRMIAGLEEITGGEVLIGNKVVNDLEPKDRGIAMVFQNYALYPHMNVYDNIAFGLKIQKVPKDEIDQRVREAAELLELTPLLPRKPKEMSGGQRQRVAMGRAIVRHPEVFLFDEPLSNLDAKLRVSMRLRILQLHQEMKAKKRTATMVYVTHDQVEAMTMADRICVLEFGHIRQVDTPLMLYNCPANKFVAGFIGSPGMNLIEAQIINIKGQLMVKSGDFEMVLPEEKAAKMKSHVGRKIWFGIRPEHIMNRTMRPHEKDNYLQGKVIVVEQMGNEVYAHFSAKGVDFTSRIPAENMGDLRHGINYDFWYDMSRCHIFDYQSEENISL